MKRLFIFARSVVFLWVLLASLALVSVATTLWALNMSSRMAMMGANATAAALRHSDEIAAWTARANATALRHRQEIAAAVARARAKARIRRAIAALPFVGAGALVYFEEQDYQEWLEDHPNGTRAEYACEVAQFSAEIVDEVLAGLPERIRPSPDTVLGWMPECDEADMPTEAQRQE